MAFLRYDIFISYSRQDAAIVLPLVEELRQRGYETRRQIGTVTRTQLGIYRIHLLAPFILRLCCRHAIWGNAGNGCYVELTPEMKASEFT